MNEPEVGQTYRWEHIPMQTNFVFEIIETEGEKFVVYKSFFYDKFMKLGLMKMKTWFEYTKRTTGGALQLVP